MQLHRVDQLSHLLDDPRGIPSGAGHNQRMTGTGNLDVDRIVHASWAEAAARPGGGHGVQDRLAPAPWHRRRGHPERSGCCLLWKFRPAPNKLTESTATSALCLRFTILTAARYNEARGALWSEIDLTSRVWSIPAARMKAGRPHRVPLSNAAVAILELAAPLKTSDDGLVFPGGRKGRPLSDVAVSKALASVIAGMTVHGMRSTFRDWAEEKSAYPGVVAEVVLAHINRNGTEAAYLRGDQFEKRRNLMNDWAAYACGETAALKD